MRVSWGCVAAPVLLAACGGGGPNFQAGADEFDAMAVTIAGLSQSTGLPAAIEVDYAGHVRLRTTVSETYTSVGDALFEMNYVTGDINGTLDGFVREDNAAVAGTIKIAGQIDPAVDGGMGATMTVSGTLDHGDTSYDLGGAHAALPTQPKFFGDQAEFFSGAVSGDLEEFGLKAGGCLAVFVTEKQ